MIKVVFVLVRFFSFAFRMEQVYGSYLHKVHKYLTCDGPRQCRGDITDAG